MQQRRRLAPLAFERVDHLVSLVGPGQQGFGCRAMTIAHHRDLLRRQFRIAALDRRDRIEQLIGDAGHR